ncbi:TniQ family protein [Streptomyces sp. TP-A0356]|uniref:TniQ family protein n=1 Tax=Streptomyces sp. TP-A0356 TaxID=1359208 RepID=UPI00099EE765|nr:TniQ family protein [Streptomyces sp. TP-A0356]
MPQPHPTGEDGPQPARTTPRRLPVVPLPQPCESLFSWVDHLAAEYKTDRTQTMARLGLEPATAHAARLARYTAELPLASALPLLAATGLDPQQLRAMTLFGIVKRSEGRVPRHPDFRWAPEETWAFCPQCLKPPERWPLWWYHSWAVMCPTHDCYTASYCPDCGSPFSPSLLRGDAPGTCPGFLRRDDNALAPPGRRRAKRKRCGRPLWEIETPPVTDPALRSIHQRLVRLDAEDTAAHPDLEQWYDDLRTLRILLEEPHALRVQVFTSTDPALRQRFDGDEVSMRWDHFDDADSLVGWQRSDCGFLYPWRRTSPSSSRQQRDPVTAAAKLTVISEVLDSPDPAAAARRVFRTPSPATLRDFGHSLPPYMHRASTHLHELLSQALDEHAFAELSDA